MRHLFGIQLATDSAKLCTYGDGVGTPVTPSTPLISLGPAAGVPANSPGSASPTGAGTPTQGPASTTPSATAPAPGGSQSPGAATLPQGVPAGLSTPGLDGAAIALGHILCGEPPPKPKYTV